MTTKEKKKRVYMSWSNECMLYHFMFGKSGINDIALSIGRGEGEGCCRYSNPRVSSVVDSVESLEPALAEDEV